MRRCLPIRSSRNSASTKTPDCGSRMASICSRPVPFGRHGATAGPGQGLPQPRKISPVLSTWAMRWFGRTGSSQWSGPTDMLLQLLVGGIVSVCNIAIHSLVMTAVVRLSRTVAANQLPHPSLHLTSVMIVAVLVLMAAHLIEVFVWATAYLVTGAAS